jgi:hypothetical protein
MTIKKPMKTAAAAPAQVGGVTIAGRLQLGTSDVAKSPAAGGKASTVAVVAGLIALAVAGILTYVLWQHWEFLMPA